MIEITWLLSFLPNWLWALVLIVGLLGLLASWILKFVPFVVTYRLPIQVVSIILLLSGVYFQGVIANETIHQQEIQKLRDKIEQQNKEAKNLTDEINKLRSQFDNEIIKKGNKIISNIDRLVNGKLQDVVNSVATENKLSVEERKKFEAKLEELRQAEKNCPVPALLIEQLNDAAVRPKKEIKK